MFLSYQLLMSIWHVVKGKDFQMQWDYSLLGGDSRKQLIRHVHWSIFFDKCKKILCSLSLLLLNSFNALLQNVDTDMRMEYGKSNF